MAHSGDIAKGTQIMKVAGVAGVLVAATAVAALGLGARQFTSDESTGVVNGSPTSNATGDPKDPQLVGSEVRILVDGAPERESMLAGVLGQLRLYAPDRCLVLDAAVSGPEPKRAPVITEPTTTPGSESWVAPIWPHGTQVITDGDRFGVQLPDGSQYWQGDRVEGGGGSWGYAEDGSYPTFGLPLTCVGNGLNQLFPRTSKPR
ncbi:MAG: hypothetical protein ACT4QF_19225 [Sporichthyaceae bacterium]